MSFRTITRSPLKTIRAPLRMMSDQQEMRTYVGYSLYKSKSAVNVKPIPATLKVENGIRTVAKEGALMFEFAPGSNKEYDWTKKSLFALSATECGELVRSKDADTVSFVHSPGMLSKRLIEYWCDANVYLSCLLFPFLCFRAAGDTTISKRLTVAPVADGKGTQLSTTSLTSIQLLSLTSSCECLDQACSSRCLTRTRPRPRPPRT
jgi:hypothetical protein